MNLRTCTDEEFLRHCRWEAFRGSGPGGQKRNKTSSAVRVVHEPTGIAVVSSESRSQAENRMRALRRLRHRVVLELREPIDPAGFRPPAWFVELTAGGRLKISRRDERYLAVMGLVLDVLEACAWVLGTAAEMLDVSTAQLSAFLQNDEELFAHANQRRSACGLRPLR